MTEPSAAALEIVDTNIFVYAADKDAGDKQIIAQELLDRLLLSGALALSSQTLNEFYVTVTRTHRRQIVAHSDAVLIIQRLVTSACVLPLTSDDSLKALRAVENYGMSYWDALIWAVAKLNAVTRIHSEDFQHGRDIEGVIFSDPFHANLSP